MNNIAPKLIDENNLSAAWLLALQHIIETPGYEISPLIISLSDFEESLEFHAYIDSLLEENKFDSIQTVSETIFPDSLYTYFKRDRHKLYEEYKLNLPRIKGIDKKNKDGTYFERLIAFPDGNHGINQLENIITALKDPNIKRRSKYQASIFDPRIDHKDGPYQRFPCLQHVTFYIVSGRGLVLNSFYAMQYLFQRGYGNWLGLINLGKFVANELQVPLHRVNCYIGIEKLDKIGKKAAKIILEKEVSQSVLNRFENAI